MLRAMLIYTLDYSLIVEYCAAIAFRAAQSDGIAPAFQRIRQYTLSVNYYNIPQQRLFTEY